jgi:acyl-coenzyme A thioesterase PaaI-like protein
MTHGGILYSALDDVMANWLFLQGARGYTARCEVRYREPLDIGAEVQLEGRLERRKARLAILAARAVRTADGKTIAEAQASFMIEESGGLDR